MGYGCPLNLALEEEGVVTDCSVKTLEPENVAEINIRDYDIPSNIIMKSGWLVDVFADLDTSAEALHITVAPTHPFFRLATRGSGGSTQVDCPRESAVVESFTCSHLM
eukprot:UC1_evm1s1531